MKARRRREEREGRIGRKEKCKEEDRVGKMEDNGGIEGNGRVGKGKEVFSCSINGSFLIMEQKYWKRFPSRLSVQAKIDF